MNAAVAKFAVPDKPRYRPENAEAALKWHAGFMARAAGPAWLQTLRRDSASLVRTQGLPTPLLERWKYTNLGPALKDFPVDPPRMVLKATGPEEFISHLADPPEWVVDLLAQRPIAEEKNADGALWHLGNAFLDDAVVIDIPAGHSVERPVEILSEGIEGAFSVPRLIVRLGEGASLTLIERHRGHGRYWSNMLAQVIVGANARLVHYRLQDDWPDAVHTQNMQLRLGRDSYYEAFTLTTGAKISRNQIHARLDGENAHCELNGVNLLRDGQHGDTTITVDHAAPHCVSHQFYRSVLDDQAHGVFQGKILVASGAQKTDGYQMSRSLILSEGAEMDTKPELEIYADDVKCSHGATTGQLDEEALFYLRSRGLGFTEARGLLIGAFIDEALEKIADEAVRAEFSGKARSWLGG